MADDYLVRSMSDHEVREQAFLVLARLKIDVTQTIDILSILGSGHIQTLSGVRRLTVESIQDDEMEGADGRTVFAKSTASIQIRSIVMSDAEKGMGRARMTLAHELGHAILHSGDMMTRKTIEMPIPKYIPAHKSAEHQAKAFASALLMPDALVAKCKSVDQIVKIAGVSSEAARIRWELLHSGATRVRRAMDLKSLSQEIRKTLLRIPNCTVI